MDWNSGIYFKGKGESTTVYGRIGYSTSSGGATMHCINTYGNQADGALYITSNGSTSANDTGGLAIDNEGVTVFGAGDAGSNFTGVFRVLNEDNVADGPQFLVTKSSGASVKYSMSANNFSSGVATGTQPYACMSTTCNTNLNADLVDGLHVHSSRNNEANKIVRTDSNGYLQCGYINSSSGNENNNSSPDRIWGSNSSDGYLRTYRTSALNVGNADTLDGYHADSFLKIRNIRSDINSIYSLRYEIGGFDKGDYGGAYADEYPVNYGHYLSTVYNDKNSGFILMAECPTSNSLGHVYIRTRGAGDWNTTFSNWGTLAYISDNVASATKLQTPRTIWGQRFDGLDNVDGIFNQSLSNAWLTSAKVQIGRTDETSFTDKSVIGTTNGNLHIDSYEGYGLYFNYYKKYGGDSSKSLIIKADGNVLIGTEINSGYKLDVNGTLRATGAAEFSNTIGAYGTINAYKNTPTSTAYNQLGIQVYSSDGSPVGIGFHRGGYSQCILEHSGGDGLTIRSSGTIGTGAYGNLTVNDVTASNYHLSLNNQVRTNSGYLELVSTGDEICVGGNTTMYVNYRPATNGTPTTWRWLAGSSTSFADFYVGGLVANGTVTAPTFVGNLNGNASTATRLTTLGSYDANNIIGGAAFNYGSPSYWVNAPSGMNYGLIGNIISGEDPNLSLQLAADINHNSTSSTKDLWFRTANNLGFQNDWKKIWHSGNFTPSDYLPLSGGTMTGNLSIIETKNILLRPNHSGYYSGIGYDTSGNECIALWAKNTVTRLRWHAGLDLTNLSNGSMMSITPDFEISKASGIATGYIGGNVILHSGNYNSYSPTLTGSGASGTWGINISGNAGNATKSNSLNITGYGSDNLTYYQAPGDFDGNSGWSHYIIANHGNGSSYFHYTIALPFWSAPMYRRQTGNTSSVTEWYTFISTENYTNWLVPKTGGTFSGAVTANRFYAGFDAGVPNSISCSDWFRSSGGTGWYNETYAGGIYMTDSTYVRVYNNKAFKVTSTASDSINTDGGVLANGTISASGIITGRAFRTTNAPEYSSIISYSSAPALYVQNSAAASTQIASFRYGSATAGSGTSVLDINSGSVVSSVGYSKSGSTDSEVLLGGGGTCNRGDVLPYVWGNLTVVNSSYITQSSVKAYQLGHIVIIQGTFKTGASASNGAAYFTIPSSIGVPFDNTGWSGAAGDQNTGIRMNIPAGSRTIYLTWNDTGTNTTYQMSWVYYCSYSA